MMRRTLLTSALMAATLLTVSACAKQDEAANTVTVNETVPNDSAPLEGNAGSPDPFGNAVAPSDNESLALNASGGAENAQ